MLKHNNLFEVPHRRARGSRDGRGEADAEQDEGAMLPDVVRDSPLRGH